MSAWAQSTFTARMAYVGGGLNHLKLYAFAVGCASGGWTCTPLWTGKTGGAISSTPAVADGVVYVGSEDGQLFALGLTP